jgi:membrane-associated protease RseP (regulator of RpoE activity)
MLSLLLLLSLFACAKKAVLREAVPLNTALKAKKAIQNSTPQIIAYNYGMTVQELTEEVATRFGISSIRGAIVMDVKNGSAAAEVGIHPQDIILQVNRVKITSVKDYEREIAKASPDKGTLLLIKRGKSAFFVALRFETNPSMAKFEAIKPEQQSSAKKDEIISSLDSTPPVILITSPDVFRGVKLTAKDASITVIGTATDASGVATVTVNGETAVLDANGNFSAEVLLKVGENRIVVAATDIRKNSATETFTVVREAGQVAKAKPKATQPAAEIGGGKYYGLIIGNNDYRYLSRLQTAVNDATTIEKVLKESYGFESRLLINATRKDILSAINECRNILTERDNLLIYYAGHGEFDRSSEKAYWLPVDAMRDDPTDWIIADDITSSIKRLSSKHVLIVSDSCYSGTLTRSARTSLINKGERDEFLKKMTSRPSRTLIASGGNEPVADGGGSGHSIFADSFLKALREINNSIFTADELFHQYIRSRVAGRSDQVPEYSEIRNSGHDGGDFVFSKIK